MRTVTSTLKLHTLLALHNEPLHGYQLIKHLKTHRRTVSPSQVYPFLSELKKTGHISERKGTRGKTTYTLTAKGKKFLTTILKEYDDLITAHLSNKITACNHCSCKIYDGGYTRKERGTTRTYCCKHCAKH